jgi:hypothetical protein
MFRVEGGQVKMGKWLGIGKQEEGVGGQGRTAREIGGWEKGNEKKRKRKVGVVCPTEQKGSISKKRGE